MRILALLAVFFAFTAMAATTQKVSIKTNACCETSQYLIEKALNKIEGVVRCELDLVTQKVKIKYDDSKVDVATLRQAIANTGFKADELPARPKAYDALPICCKGDGKTCKKPE
ncbi:MAG: heavy metal-associated domain-containing protein [Bacteroidota bacterium]